MKVARKRTILGRHRKLRGVLYDQPQVVAGVLTGGQERTRAQFRDLFARTGLRLKRIVPTDCPLSIVEGVRA